jgi:integrase
VRKPPQPRKKTVNGHVYAVVTLSDGTGKRKDHVLGRWESPDAEREYARLIAEWEAQGRRLPENQAGPDFTVNELLERFWEHVEQHYRHPDGSPTSEVDNYKLSLRPLRHFYGHTLAREFGPLALKAVRQAMVGGYEHPEYGPQRGLARGLVNQRVGRIRRAFKWAVENELLPAAVFQALAAVRGLQRGRSPARETDPVQPVPETWIEAVLPHVLPPVRAMIELQLLTGMRPGEAVVMRGCDLDTTGPVWLYRVPNHKNAWRGHQRVIALGPKAQAVIKPFLRLNTQEFLFSPREAMAAFRAAQRAARKTKVQPSQQDRAKPKPRKAPGERYTVRSYSQAIRKGSQKAKVPHFHPHQIRHTTATKLRREFGLDTARVVLGHRSPQITELYAELDVSRAAEVAAKLG